MVWLTERRVRLYCGLIILFYLCCWSAMLWFTCQPDNKRVCDFVQFWTAGKLANEGKLAAIYDFDTFIKEEQAVLGRYIDPIVFRYPPTLLLVVRGLAYLPYGFAYGLFAFCSVVAFTIVSYVIYPHSFVPWLVLACPIVYENVSFGQNGLINGAIFGLSLHFLQKRPLLAGFFFGLLTYKVHLVWLVPFALISGRHWKTLIVMVATALLMVLLSLLFLGQSSWQAFAAITGPNTFFQPVVSFADMVTPWGGVYLVTENVSLAWAVQLPLTLCAPVQIFWLWRQDVSFSLKAAVLLLLALISSPYAFVYDLSLMGLALIFLVKEGVQEREEKYFILAWSFVFLSSLLAAAHSLPLAPLVVLAMTGLAWRRLLIAIIAGGTSS